MAVTQYIGSRYVPLFADPIEWSSQNTYEPLTIVLHEGNSYTSRQAVPKDIAIDNEEFWALTGNYNAQVELYRRETAAAKEAADDALEKADNLDVVLPSSEYSESHTVSDAIAEVSASVLGVSDLLPASDFSAVNTVSKAIADSTQEAKTYFDERSNILIAHIMMRVLNSSDWKPKLCISKNGLDWTPVAGSFDTDVSYGEMSRPYFKGEYAYFVCRNAGVSNSLAYYATKDFVDADFRLISTDIPMHGISTNWTPQIVEDANGDTYIISTVFTGNTFSTYTINQTIGETIFADTENAPTDSESVCYITPVTIEDGIITASGSSVPLSVRFGEVTQYCGIDYDILYWNNAYHLLYRDTRFQTICHATASNIYGPYVIADYDNLAIFKDVNLEAPVMTVIDDTVYVNFQTYGRSYGSNLLVSTKDFEEWAFIGYPRRIDKNQFGFWGASTHGERPRNISPQLLPASFITDAISKTVPIETGGFHSSDLGTRVPYGDFALPAFNAYHKLSGKSMCPAMPNSAFIWNHTGNYNETDIKQNAAMMYIPFYYSRFYGPTSISLYVRNANRLIAWRLLGQYNFFGGAGEQTFVFDVGTACSRIGQTTVSYSVELASLIENNPVRAFLNVPCNGGHVEIKIIRKGSTYTGENIAASTNLFKLPFKVVANKQIPHITPDSVGDIRFTATASGYIQNNVVITNALATGAWECSIVLTQWNVDPNSIS